MKDIKTALIAKSLEGDRDIYLPIQKDLATDLLKRQLNIFFLIYTLSISDENVVLDKNNSLLVYRAFYGTKFNGVRFLLELFLTSLEILSKKTDAEKNYLVASLGLSEKINMHLTNKEILSLNPVEPNYIAAVEEGKKNYTDFIRKYGKISPLMPDEIEVFFSPENEGLLRANKERQPNFIGTFGFTYYKHSKLNYGNVIEQNPQLKKLVTKLKNIGIFPQSFDIGFIKKIYSLVSGVAHPTISTIEDSEKFISKNPDEKIEIIMNTKDGHDTFLKVIGLLMDVLYKESRGMDIKNPEYRNSLI